MSELLLLYSYTYVLCNVHTYVHVYPRVLYNDVNTCTMCDIIMEVILTSFDVSNGDMIIIKETLVCVYVQYVYP